MATHTAMAQGNDPALRDSLEKRMGICHFVTPKDRQWHGQARTRFSDFLVNEITQDGQVLHLHNFHTNARDYANDTASGHTTQKPAQAPTQTRAQKPAEGQTSNELGPGPQPETEQPAPEGENGAPKAAPSSPDSSALITLVGEDVARSLVALSAKPQQDPKANPKTFGNVVIPAVTDRQKRGQIHMEVRRVFEGRLETTTESDGSIKAFIPARGSGNSRDSRNPRNRPQQNKNIQEERGKFLHFTLYKENRDTMDAISAIAYQQKLKPQFFNTAGTKDRRAVTVQRVSLRGRSPQSLLSVNSGRIPGVKIGDFKFEAKPLYLGCHQGNEFTIVLKNCWFSETEDLPSNQRLEIAKSTVGSALTQLTQHGFLNYFGTQRFGTFEIGTQEVGMKILKGDFEGAVKSLLAFDPAHLQVAPGGEHQFRREDVSRAHGCAIFLDKGDFQEAFKYLPPRCRTERDLMRHLSGAPNDFLGALQTIPRTMRSMYGHAYQSLVWNFVASMRWERYGKQIVRGDLVLVKPDAPGQGDEDAAELDEETLHLAERHTIDTKKPRAKVHALADEDINSGKYSIFDVVLPTPGWDVVYPDNDIGQFYAEFMGRPENGSLDPHSMHRRQKDFSLPGSYRSFMGKLGRTPSMAVRQYGDDTEQLVPTDLNIIHSRKAQEAAEAKAKAAELKSHASNWQKFTENVQEVERAEARAAAERRKAEGPPEVPAAPINDTWVQTSLDGSHKRIKVARHEAEQIQSEAVPAVDSTSLNPVDAMRVDSGSPNEQTLNTRESMDADPNDSKNETTNEGLVHTDNNPVVDFDKQYDEKNLVEVGEQKSVGPQDGGDNETGRSSIANFTAQVRALFVAFFMWLWSTLVSATDSSNTKSTPNPPPPDLSTTVEPMTGASLPAPVDHPHPAPSNEVTHGADPPNDAQNEPTNDGEPVAKEHVNDESAAWTHLELTQQIPHPSASATTDAAKIAVILRFSLDTSQYATMVLRELQGASPE